MKKSELTDKEVDDWWENKFKESLREKHDEVKEHPFWRTLSNDFHTDCMDKMRDMLNMFIGHFNRETIETCPQAIIVLELMHNIFDSILKAKIMPKYHHKTIMETKAFGNYILCLQTALQLVHYYLDGIYSERDVVGYDPRLNYNEEEDTYDSCTYKTFTALENEDGTYRLVQIIKKDEVDELAEWNKGAATEHARIAKDFAERGSQQYAESALKKAEYYNEKYEDLIGNKEKHYIIK
jgi:hypothetical protein